MSKYLKNNKRAESSPALRRVRRNVIWQAGLALTTIVLTIVILFAMTSAWYTNIAQTSGLNFQAEAWGFDGQIIVGSENIKAAPGDEGTIHLEVKNSSQTMTAVGVSANKSRVVPDMQQRLYFYIETQLVRNGETMDRVYLNSLSSYTYTLFAENNLILTEQTHNNAPLKWHWVYDMLGYYVLGSWSDDTFTEIEYLRPVEYDYDSATFDYVTSEDGTVTIELMTVDGKTTVRQFLAKLSDTDGYENDIDYSNPKGKGYYPVDVDEEGYGVYVYLCNAAEIEQATKYDTVLGQNAAGNTDPNQIPSYPVTVTVSAQKNDENVVPVATLTALNSAVEMLEGSTIQLTENITLTGNEKILIPTGSKVIVDLNGNTITSQTGDNAIEAQPGSSVIFVNGKVEGIDKAAGIYSVGADVTLNKMELSGFVDCIYIGDNKANNSMDSKVRVVDCVMTGKDSAIYVSGNGLVSEQKTQVVVEGSTLKSDCIVIWGSGDASGNGRWGTDIQVIDSVLESNPEKVGAGIFHPQKNSTLTVYNSTVSGYNGIAIKGGIVSVKASTVLGKGAAEGFDADGNPVTSGSGYADTGDGIYIEANYGYEIRLEISGAVVTKDDGTTGFRTSVVESENSKSLRVWEPDASNVSVKIINGEFGEEQPERYIASGSFMTQKGEKYVVTVTDN